MIALKRLPTKIDNNNNNNRSNLVRKISWSGIPFFPSSSELEIIVVVKKARKTIKMWNYYGYIHRRTLKFEFRSILIFLMFILDLLCHANETRDPIPRDKFTSAASFQDLDISARAILEPITLISMKWQKIIAHLLFFLFASHWYVSVSCAVTFRAKREETWTRSANNTAISWIKHQYFVEGS